MPILSQLSFLYNLINDLSVDFHSFYGHQWQSIGNPVTQVFQNNVCWGVL